MANNIYRGVEIVEVDCGGYIWHSDQHDAADTAQTIEEAKRQIDAVIVRAAMKKGDEEPEWIIEANQAVFMLVSRMLGAEGATWFRFTWGHVDRPASVLIEAWRVQPRHEGIPRWDKAVKREPSSL